MPAGYKLVTYASAKGPRAGLVVGETVYDASVLTGKADYVSVLAILNDWESASPLCKAAAASGRDSKVDHSPLAHTKVLNIAPEPDPKSVGLKPWHFIKASRTIADPGATVRLPTYSKMVDWEAELGAFI